jgi:hypothetical protein
MSTAHGSIRDGEAPMATGSRGWRAWWARRWPATHPMWVALAARTRSHDWWAGA